MGSMRERLAALLGSSGATAAGRVRGVPPSANGASSFHLRWHLDEPLAEVSVTLEVLMPPSVPRLYFWALQADVQEPSGHRAGGAHLGLQWHPGHPGSRAVNWGGYGPGGGELTGSASELSSATGNVNTRDLRWADATPHRLRIHPAGPPGAWRGEVTDLRSGHPVVVRDLHTTGDRIAGVVVWSEVFARCDDPSVQVRWSDAQGTTTDGRTVEPRAWSVNYQSHADGGCANTDSSPDGTGVVQRTATERRTPQGAVVPAR